MTMIHALRNLSMIVFLPWLLATPVYLTAQTPSDEELKALEQQIEKKETEQAEAKKKAEAEAKKKAEAERKKKEEAATQRRAAEEEKKKQEEASKQAAELEKKKQEAEEAKQADEVRKKQGEEKLKAGDSKNDAGVQTGKGIPIQGAWLSTDDQGNIVFVDANNGKVRGIYRNILYSGEIEGDFRDHTLTGYWSETISRQSCADKRNGNQYWGRLVFSFDAEFKSFSGKWGYCDAEPALPWNGLRAK